MFTDKQSDVFYNDETKELFVCTVSSVSASRCEGDSTVYGALPIIYKIDKESNFKKCVYPNNLDTFTTDLSSDLFSITSICTTLTGNNFASISKPLINFNKTTNRYSVTFLGRYESHTDGLGINNFIFENVKDRFHLLTSNAYLPQDTLSASDVENVFTFESPHINSDLYIGGNSIRNDKPSWFNPEDGDVVERSTDYSVAPTFVETTSSLGFNLILDNIDTTTDTLTGDKNYPLMYSGGYITINPKYVAFDPSNTIRVDFRARAFNFTDSPTAYGSTQTTGQSATRWIQQYDPAGAGEGFCVFFFKNPDKDKYVIPNGIGSTLGYSKADFSPNEVAGTAHETVGLYERGGWSPQFGPTTSSYNEGVPANSFLGIGFDIAGNFVTTSEDKPGYFNPAFTTATAKPCSVGVRGNRYYNMPALTAVKLDEIAGGTTVPLHTSAADAQFVDYRVEVANKGKRLTVYHKLTSATDYNTILELRLDRIAGGNVGVGSSYDSVYGNNAEGYYDPWKGLREADGSLPLLNVGLSFTTSTFVSRFELKSFEVTGIKVRSPWNTSTTSLAPEVNKTKEGKSKIDYLSKSSKNIRKRLVNADTDDDVDIEMVIPSTNKISKDLQSELPEITLCDDNDPSIRSKDVEIKITKIPPSRVDKIITKIAEQGDTTGEFDIETTEQDGGSGGTKTVFEEPPVRENPCWEVKRECMFKLDPLGDVDTDVDTGPASDDTVRQHNYHGYWFTMSNGKKTIWLKGYECVKTFSDNVDSFDWFAPSGQSQVSKFVEQGIGGKGGLKEFIVTRERAAEGIGGGLMMKRLLRAIINAFGKLNKKIVDTSDEFYLNLDLERVDWRTLNDHMSVFYDFKGEDGESLIGLNEDEWEQKFINIGFVPFNSKKLTDPGENPEPNTILFSKCLAINPKQRYTYKVCKKDELAPPDPKLTEDEKTEGTEGTGDVGGFTPIGGEGSQGGQAPVNTPGIETEPDPEPEPEQEESDPDGLIEGESGGDDDVYTVRSDDNDELEPDEQDLDVDREGFLKTITDINSKKDTGDLGSSTAIEGGGDYNP